MSIERKLITIANKDIDKGKIDRDFGDVVETNLSVVIEYSVIGILRYDDFLVVDSQAVHADQGLQFVGHATAGLGLFCRLSAISRLFYNLTNTIRKGVRVR